jgi:hypothetical protein
MIWKDLVVTSNERKTFRACGIPNGLTVNSDANFLLAI